MTFQAFIGAIVGFICVMFALVIIAALAWWLRYVIAGVGVLFVVLTAYHYVLIRMERHKARMTK